MGDEYEETKIRTYATKHHKGEGAISKYIVKPITKAMGFKDKEADSRSRRLTA